MTIFSSTMNSARRLKTLTGYVSTTNHLKQGKQFIHTFNFWNHNNCTSSTVNSSCIRQRENVMRIERYVSLPVLLCRKASSKSLPEPYNMFGDLSANTYLQVEMDEEEAEHEKFEETDARLARWQKLRPSQYAALIKNHAIKRDPESALKVLDLIKQNRDKPNVYMYNLIIRAFAVQGNIKRCFKLFNDMKKRDLIPTAATYNSLINACAMSTHRTLALERLDYLRQLFVEKNIPMNSTHYNTLIKAYSMHNQIGQTLQLADEMYDKRFRHTATTFACLLHGAVSDKKTGLRHAIMLWHLMRVRKITPTIYHYNLLLKIIRDSKLGQLKVGDALVPIAPDTKVQFTESDQPDLLAVPPLLSSLLLPLTEKSENKSTAKLSDPATMVCSHLDDILANNRLILFGGYKKFLDRMEEHRASPDTKTLTMIMELLPNSIQAEEEFLKYVEKHKFAVDVQFFNMIIRKRNLRGDRKNAKAVLNQMQRHHLMPDIMTFGVLALGCDNHNHAVELLQEMEHNGFVPNEVVVTTLIHKACMTRNFTYVVDMMKYMVNANIVPSQKLFEILERFETLVLNDMEQKKDYNFKKGRISKSDYDALKGRYNYWKEKLKSMKKR